MSIESDLIVIDDDDDDDTVEIINIEGYEESCHDEEVPNVKNKETDKKASKKQVLPKQIHGYTRPSISYTVMIAHALASSPNHQATAINICNNIAEKYPYFKVCPSNWKQSIYSALVRQKKCFVIVDTNKDGEYVWSYNPLFENYILDNWVPKYIQGNALQQRSSGSEIHRNHTSTVVSQNELNMANPALFLNFGPESSENGQSLTTNISWEAATQVQESDSYNGDNMPSDFLPGNACHSQISLNSDEAEYRLKFQGEHPKVEKFRLHCTVCDIHLGTSGKSAETNVRFHSRLGVLTCVNCYARTINLKQAKCVCSWCNTWDRAEGYVNCSSVQCSANFCKLCVRRNFGEHWLNRILQRTDWKCFLCDMKQIWPHRTIAYSLYIHYSDLRKLKIRMMNQVQVLSKEKPNLQFYLIDKSTCCNISTGTILKNAVKSSSDKSFKPRNSNLSPRTPIPILSSGIATNLNMLVSAQKSKLTDNCFSSSGPSLSSGVETKSNMLVSTQNSKSIDSCFRQRTPPLPSQLQTQPTMFVSTHNSNQQQTLVIEERSPNHFFVQSSEGGPHVTVNTGTQYIHNIYPESNFTVVQPPTLSSLPGTFPSTQTMVSFPTTQTVNLAPRPQQIFVDTLSHNQSSDQNIPHPQFQEDIATELVVEEPIYSFPEDNSSYDPLKPLSNTTFDSKNISMVSVESKGDSIISQNNSVEKDLPSPMPTTSFGKELDKIKLKPMPKSKKQSILRSILQRQQLESMEKNVHYDFGSSCDAILDGPDKVDARVNKNHILILDPKVIKEPNQQIECVEIKSDHSTSQVQTFDLSTNNHLNVAFESINNPIQNVHLQNSVTNNIPKIKVKTLEELQDHRNGPREQVPTQTNIPVLEKEQDDEKVDSEIETVDVSHLKQGIIEASRTLVTTQKKFKELARTISSQVLYEVKTAKKLIKKFQEILKLCKRQVEDVDNNVSSQYKHLFPNMDLGLLLKSIQQENEENTKKQVKHNKPIAYIRKQHKDSNDRTVIEFEPYVEETTSAETSTDNRVNFQETSLSQSSRTLKRKRDLVDINPLGKKIIQGSPVVTQEEVDEMNNLNITSFSKKYDVFMSELKSKQLKLRRKKKKLDRSYIKRTKWNHKKKYRFDCKNKKQGQRRKLEDDDCHGKQSSSFYYKTPDSGVVKSTRVKTPSIPLRVSHRNHPSTACLGLIASSDTSDYPTVKPCSVLLHRLDPRIVKLQEMRFLE